MSQSKKKSQAPKNSSSLAGEISGDLAGQVGVEGAMAGVEALVGLGKTKASEESIDGFSTGGSMEAGGFRTGGEVADDTGLSEWIEEMVSGAGDVLSSTGDVVGELLSSTGEMLGDVAEGAGEIVGGVIGGIAEGI